jgi:hypothetical protein
MDQQRDLAAAGEAEMIHSRPGIAVQMLQVFETIDWTRY